MTSNKIISFSLWGADPKYTRGALRNAELAKTIYSDWTARFYCASSVPNDIVEALLQRNVEVISVDHPGDWTSMFWRFAPAGEDDVFAMISRDCDSRLSAREKAAVDEWLVSNKDFHIMRDHPFHRYPIMGGMWGAKRGVLREIDQLLMNFRAENRWGVDQDFLAQVVFPIVKKQSMIHDEFYAKSKFPTRRKDFEYVGEIFDQDDHPNLPLRNILTHALSESSRPPL